MYIKYLKYVLEHKKNVFIECMKLAMQHHGKIKRQLIIHAFTHDLSKFLPCEFIPYARKFYGDYPSITDHRFGQYTGKFKEDIEIDFDKAWEHHYKNNKHHWNYWIGKNMPYNYIMQMIADWKGMARKFGDTEQEYYLKHYHEFDMTYQTRLDVEMDLNINESPYHNYGHTLEDFANMYDEETYNNNFGWLKDKYKIDTYNLLK